MTILAVSYSATTAFTIQKVIFLMKLNVCNHSMTKKKKNRINFLTNLILIAFLYKALWKSFGDLDKLHGIFINISPVQIAILYFKS